MGESFRAAHFDRWIERLREDRPTVVIREMAREYKVHRDTLACMVSELYRNSDTHTIHMIWAWDMDKTGSGLTDAELDEYLSRHWLA